MPREFVEKWDKASAEQPAGTAAFPVPRYVQEHSFPERERDRYVSRSLGYLVLLNGTAALILMAVVALNPESTSRRLAWAMMVFASGAMAGLASSLLAYIRRLFAASFPTHVFLRDFLRIGALVLAVAAGAAFLTGTNMVSLIVPEGSTTRMKSKPTNKAPAPSPENQAPSPKPENRTPSQTGNNERVTSNIAKGATL
jgi:hypothetical protein